MGVVAAIYFIRIAVGGIKRSNTGNNTILSNGNKAANGFEALKDLDSNNDGKIDNHVSNSIYIGGDNENSIPESIFLKLLKNFPNTYELNKYASAVYDSSASSISINFSKILSYFNTSILEYSN
jgi:hypothetical protein